MSFSYGNLYSSASNNVSVGRPEMRVFRINVNMLTSWHSFLRVAQIYNKRQENIDHSPHSTKHPKEREETELYKERPTLNAPFGLIEL